MVAVIGDNLRDVYIPTPPIADLPVTGIFRTLFQTFVNNLGRPSGFPIPRP